MDECPTHRGQPRDDCGYCEAAIARVEAARDDPDPGGREADRAADRYERWLDSCGP